jgi:hypothetical protein
VGAAEVEELINVVYATDDAEGIAELDGHMEEPESQGKG